VAHGDVTLPLGEEVPLQSEALQPGAVFGRFLIIERVGGGGVGEVFAAYDPDLDRRVALKVLLQEGAATGTGSASEAGQGLLREAKAAAQLAHPHVVTVYEVGEADGRAFIAMELVEGTDLGAWIDAREQVDWRVALELMIQAGDGLAAAHERGTIHRDFKPANVLVGSDGRARVGDFGLATLDISTTAVNLEADADARAVQTMQTQAGRLIGTPYFMAPELFDGAPHSIESDVYAYCVTLYEAIFGTRPFSAGSILELQVAKRKGEDVPPRDGEAPSALRQAIARGLSVEPADRWRSMKPLLATLRECLVTRRSPVWWVVGAVSVIAAGAALVVPAKSDDPCSGGDARVASVWSAERRATVTQALDTNDAARVSKDEVLAALDGFVGDWAGQYRGVCEAARRGERSDQALDGAMACLERDVIEFETFTTLLGDANADALLAAPSGVSRLSDPHACGRPGRLDGPEPPPNAIAESVRSVDADVSRVRGLVAAAAFPKALELARDAQQKADGLGYAPLQARATYWLGSALHELETPSAAAEAFERALWTAHRSGELEVPAMAALALAELGVGGLDRPDDARRFIAYAEAEIDRRDLAALRPDLERTRAMLSRLERNDDAVIEAHERALAMLGDASPLRRADHLSTYAADLGRLGRIPRAIELLNQSVEILEGEVGTSHPLYAESLGRLGLAYRIHGDLERAETLSKRALEIQLEARGPEHARVAFQRRRLGDFYWRTERIPEAIDQYEQLLAVDEALYTPPNRHLASDYTELASLYATAQRSEQAAEAFGKAIAAYGDTAPADTVADTRCKYGGLLHNMGRLDEAAGEADAGLKMLEVVQSVGARDAVRMCARSRALIASSRGESALAIEMAEMGLAIAEADMGPNHPGLLRDLIFLSDAYESSGDLAGATAPLERALDLPQPESQANLVALTEVTLARLVVDQDRPRAEALARAALERMSDDGPGPAEIRSEAAKVLGQTM
jgi:serine/threonine-protein kinase